MHAADVGLLEVDDPFCAERRKNVGLQDALVFRAGPLLPLRGDVLTHELGRDFAEGRDRPRLAPFLERVRAALDRAEEFTRELAGLCRRQ